MRSISVLALCVAAVFLLGLLFQALVAAGQREELTHQRYNATVLQGGGEEVGEGVCPSTSQQASLTASIIAEVGRIIQSHNNLSCNCQDTGWRRVAYLDMKLPNESCPGDWRLIDTPRRSCGRAFNDRNGCYSANFTIEEQYSQVCGRVIGYQFGGTDAFGSGTSDDLESYYVEGVSITHGRPRTHIWTFAAAFDELSNKNICPCTNSKFSSTIQSKLPTHIIGEDYFCETGAPSDEGVDRFSHDFYADDPLWDGKNCGNNSTCCSFNNPPWFFRRLPQATSDDIEVRICAATGRTHPEDTPVELLEVCVR